MGPSGAGKSSLMNALAGFRSEATGTLIVNGCEHPLRYGATIMPVIGNYVLQDDFLFPQLTVRESLNFAACMKLPSQVNTKGERDRMIKVLLDRLGLVEVASRRIDRLSGGQKKRLSVALELINYPPVLFLDEPTSGLDSFSSYKLIRLLKDLTKAGCNVICTIHQPNSKMFHMFDTLFVLAKGGRCAYQGPAAHLVEYMRICHLPVCPPHVNPADFVFEGDHIDKLYSAGKSVPSDVHNLLGTSSGYQNRKVQPKKSYLKRMEAIDIISHPLYQNDLPKLPHPHGKAPKFDDLTVV